MKGFYIQASRFPFQNGDFPHPLTLPYTFLLLLRWLKLKSSFQGWLECGTHQFSGEILTCTKWSSSCRTRTRWSRRTRPPTCSTSATWTTRWRRRPGSLVAFLLLLLSSATRSPRSTGTAVAPSGTFCLSSLTLLPLVFSPSSKSELYSVMLSFKDFLLDSDFLGRHTVHAACISWFKPCFTVQEI